LIRTQRSIKDEQTDSHTYKQTVELSKTQIHTSCVSAKRKTVSITAFEQPYTFNT